MQNCCTLEAIGLNILGGILSAVIALLMQDRSVRVRLYTLESELVDLQNKVLSEIKKRAQMLKPKRDELDDIAEKLKEKPQDQPWWAQFTNSGPKA